MKALVLCVMSLLLAGSVGATPQAVHTLYLPSVRMPLAPGCAADACDGLDPIRAGCTDDAVTLVTSPRVKGLAVQLHYSARCQARWATATTTVSNARLIASLSAPGAELFLYVRTNVVSTNGMVVSKMDGSDIHTVDVKACGTVVHMEMVISNCIP